MSSRLKVLVSLVLGLTISLLIAGVALADGIGPSGTFFDDDGNIHEGAIQAISFEGITKGCNPPQNTDYCPSANVSRGAMAAFLNRALDLPPTGTDFFSDDDGSIFEADINRLAASGITKGCNPPTNDRYCPEGNVTRGHMAAFLVRAFGYTDDGGGNLFIDDDDSIFEGDIDRLGTAGVTKGCNPPTNDRYCPRDLVKRDQMASFLSRAMGLSTVAPSLDQSSQLGTRLNLIEAAQSAGCPAAFDTFSDGILDVCEVTTSVNSGSDFWVQHGWGRSDWLSLSPAEQAEAVKGLKNSTFQLSLNGTPLKMYESWGLNESGDSFNHLFNFQFPWWLEGTHRLVGDWIDNGVTEFRVVADVNLSG